jgi:hypothetical protein
VVAQTNNIQVSLGLLKSTQHHYDTLSRPDFNVESGGVMRFDISSVKRLIDRYISGIFFVDVFDTARCRRPSYMGCVDSQYITEKRLYCLHVILSL